MDKLTFEEYCDRYNKVPDDVNSRKQYDNYVSNIQGSGNSLNDMYKNGTLPEELHD